MLSYMYCSIVSVVLLSSAYVVAPLCAEFVAVVVEVVSHVF